MTGAAGMMFRAVNLVASIRTVSEIFGWSKSKTDRFLKRLEDEQMITRRRASQGRTAQIIHLSDYETYYGPDSSTCPGSAIGTEQGRKAGQNRPASNKQESKQDSNKGLKAAAVTIPSGISNPSSNLSTPPSVVSSNSETIREPDMATIERVIDRCFELSNLRPVAAFAPALRDFNPVASWLRAGANPERDIYPLVAAKSKPSIRSWAWFTPAIMEQLARATYLEKTSLNGDSHADTTNYISSRQATASTAGNPTGAAFSPATANRRGGGSPHALMLAGALAQSERAEGND
jgi:hypothetical protein